MDRCAGSLPSKQWITVIVMAEARLLEKSGKIGGVARI